MHRIGETISHYRILEKLGAGGMGEVYTAEDTRLKRVVALKFLSPALTLDADAKTRFVREAQAASSLQHHHICTIHEIDETPDGQLFMCMDYYAGESLKERIDRGSLSLGEVMDIAGQLAAGLAHAHEAGVVHRDVKPANITITRDGVVKVLDFGLAMLSDRSRVTKTGTTVGTVAYMSPEQARGEEVGAGADVWSSGVILYEMLAGRLPFRASHEAALLYAIINEPHVPIAEMRDDVPPSLAGILERALSKNPAQRYRDAGEMARELTAVTEELEARERTSASGTGDRSPARPSRRARVWLPLALGAAIVAAVLVLKPLFFESEVVSAPRPIAVISFENQTGDPHYDYLRQAIPNLLITALEQSEYLSVVTWERMHDLLAQAGRGDVEVIDKEMGFEVCRMDGVDVIVVGSFAKAGDVFATDVKVLDVQSKELLKSASARGTGVGSILESQIDALGREISKGVGLSERLIVAAGSRPIASVTTSSMDAYDYFLRGKEAYEKFYYTDALRDLERAVALDSTFAVAWLYLARAQDRAREMKARDASYARAMALSAAASEKDRLYIEALYANGIDNDDDRYRTLLTELVTKYPKEKEAFVLLGSHYRNMLMFDEAEAAFMRAIDLDPNYGEPLNGIAYLYAAMEDYERAITYFQRYAATDPDDANPFDSMGEMYFRMGQFDEAIAMYGRALEVRPDFGSERGMAYVVALREDYAGAIRLTHQYMAAATSPGARVSGGFILAYYYLYSCRWQAAIETLGRVENAFDQMGFRWGLAGTRWLESWVRYQMGDYERARARVDEAMAIATSVKRQDSWLIPVSETMKGLVDLKEGRLGEAKVRAADIEAALPEIAAEDPLYWVSSVYLSALYSAEILLAEGEVDRCIEACETLRTPGPPPMSPTALFFYNFPAERDVLARAYAAGGALDEAIAEYERLVTFDPARKERRLVYPLLHYRLARLYEGKGRPDAAARQYERFLEIVGEGDPALTEAGDARARLAALSQNQGTP